LGDKTALLSYLTLIKLIRFHSNNLSLLPTSEV